MELELELSPLIDLSNGEHIFAEIQGLLPSAESARIVTQLLEIAVTQALLVFLPGVFIDNRERARPPFPLTPPEEFVTSVAAKFDTCRTNRCRVVAELPSSQPKFRDFLLFSGDAAKAEEAWGEYGTAELADEFFPRFEAEFLPMLDKRQEKLTSFDLDQNSAHLHAALWRLALDVSLGPENGGDVRGHFADSVEHLMRREIRGPLEQVVERWGSTFLLRA